MSAAFKLARKKVSQQDLRRLMQEQKNLRSNEVGACKVDSPFAKYDNNGQLSCQLCKKPIKEAVWKIHVNSKQHKDNLAHAKELKQKLETSSKKPTMQERVAAMKEGTKLKGILKNSSNSSQIPQIDVSEAPEPVASSVTLPKDFFDSKTNESTQVDQRANAVMLVDDALPEGFFDDPRKDAKARNLEYKDPVEEEWDRFRKEIKEAEVKSTNIINEEQEESTAERQIDEIDAQIKNWSRFVLNNLLEQYNLPYSYNEKSSLCRVLELEKKKDLLVSKPKSSVEAMTAQQYTSSSEDEDSNELLELDWRAKKSHK